MTESRRQDVEGGKDSLDFIGARDYTLYVKDLRTGTLLPDRAEKVSSVAWSADPEVLFYVTEDHAKRPYRLWRHRLGRSQSEDVLVHEETDALFRIASPKWSTELAGLERLVGATIGSYGDFELSLDWKVGPRGNAGLFYRATEQYSRVYWSAHEYQVFTDDTTYADGRNPLTSAGAVYGFYPAARGVVKPANEWNTTKIMAKGTHVEHWLNGEKLLEYEIGSDDWNRRVAASKFKDKPLFGKAAKGRICLQDHSDKIEYRGIRIRPLPDPDGETAAALKTAPENLLQRAGQILAVAVASLFFGIGHLGMGPLAVRFDDTWTYGQSDPHNPNKSKEETNVVGVKQGTCVHLGNCDIGCDVNARNTLDQNYLAGAEQKGAQVKPLHIVRHIVPVADGYEASFAIGLRFR